MNVLYTFRQNSRYEMSWIKSSCVKYFRRVGIGLSWVKLRTRIYQLISYLCTRCEVLEPFRDPKPDRKLGPHWMLGRLAPAWGTSGSCLQPTIVLRQNKVWVIDKWTSLNFLLKGETFFVETFFWWKLAQMRRVSWFSLSVLASKSRRLISFAAGQLCS